MNALLHRIAYYAAQSLRGEPVAHIVRELERSQRWPPERLRSLQWARQRALALHAFEASPFYRERWSARAVIPELLNDPQDWERLPVLEKRDLQTHAAAMRARGQRPGLEAPTSGSSGTPVSVRRSHLSWAHAHANVIRGWHWHGIAVGERYAYFWGLPLDLEGRQVAARKDRFFNRDRCSAFDLDAGSAREYYRRQLRRPSRWAFGYPSALTRFAEEIAALGLDGRALGWKAVVTTAEVLKPHQRERMVATFGCPVADSYGCAEAGVAGFECAHGGMHVPVESVVVELLPAGDGLAEILLTDLHNWSQPLVRYRVGDLVEPAPHLACECGVALPLLGRLSGRVGDTLELPDGRHVNANLPSYVFKHHGREGTVREYQFVQFSSGRIELRIVTGPAWSDAVRERLRAEVREALGIEVAVAEVARIERRGRGKHRDFVRAEDLREG